MDEGVHGASVAQHAKARSGARPQGTRRNQCECFIDGILFRQKAATQDGRELRRYRKRWKVEQIFAWLQNYRRLVVRWDFKLENYTASLQLGCFLILSKYL